MRLLHTLDKVRYKVSRFIYAESADRSEMMYVLLSGGPNNGAKCQVRVDIPNQILIPVMRTMKATVGMPVDFEDGPNDTYNSVYSKPEITYHYETDSN